MPEASPYPSKGKVQKVVGGWGKQRSRRRPPPQAAVAPGGQPLSPNGHGKAPMTAFGLGQANPPNHPSALVPFVLAYKIAGLQQKSDNTEEWAPP